jgi:hypothetical protein
VSRQTILAIYGEWFGSERRPRLDLNTKHFDDPNFRSETHISPLGDWYFVGCTNPNDPNEPLTGPFELILGDSGTETLSIFASGQGTRQDRERNSSIFAFRYGGSLDDSVNDPNDPIKKQKKVEVNGRFRIVKGSTSWLSIGHYQIGNQGFKRCSFVVEPSRDAWYELNPGLSEDSSVQKRFAIRPTLRELGPVNVKVPMLFPLAPLFANSTLDGSVNEAELRNMLACQREAIAPMRYKRLMDQGGAKAFEDSFVGYTSSGLEIEIGESGKLAQGIVLSRGPKNRDENEKTKLQIQGNVEDIKG